jgi:hypothetical protein
MIYYRVYGLTFRSDCELPGLDPIPETSAVDYSLRFDDKTDWFETLRRECHRACYISSWRLKCGRTVVEVCRTEDCRKFFFRFCDGIEFIVDRERENIWVDGLRNASLQAAVHHLLFSLPGFLLGLRKSACMHGAAIRRGDGAIALLGGSNSGKSVLSAHMATRGIEVLSDELVALDVIDGDVLVYPGYPWICLRPESLPWLQTASMNAGQIGSKWHYLDEAYVTWDLRRTDGRSQSRKRKLDAIYLLTPVEDSNCEPAIEQVPQHQALIALMEAADRTRIPYPEFRLREFSLLGSVASAVPTYQLRYPVSAQGLKAVTGLLIQSPGLRRQHSEAET